ncbi:MAG: BadF/BadG/BcrA/BcrD ATPase family protein [Geminicoccaceae bacterium]
MNGSGYVLAIDGGGTKTAAALLTWAGETLATCRTGPANLYRDPVAGLAEIRRAWGELCRLAELSPDATAARTLVSAGLAGASGQRQRHAFAEACTGFAARRLSSDGYIGYLGVFGRASGALVSIGTGVVAYRCGPGKKPEIRSGWGFPVADRGSGAWLGLRLAAEYLDHLDAASPWPRSSLWAPAEAALGREREEVLLWLAQARAVDFAELARAVVAAAGDGDELGMALMAEGVEHLARLARAVAAGTQGALCLAGGLAETYRPFLTSRLDLPLLPAATRPDPLHGAWLIASGAAEPEYDDVR